MRQLVIASSVIADLLDLTVVGHFLYFIDIAVIILHLVYAGPKALAGVLDMIPAVGMLPVFTILAVRYKKE
jgi:hypothetical protein